MAVTVVPVVFDELAREVSAAVAETLATARKERGVTFRELTERTELSRAHLDRLLRGQTPMELQELVRISIALSLDPQIVMRDAWVLAQKKSRR